MGLLTERPPESEVQGVYSERDKRSIRVGFDYSRGCQASRRNMSSAEVRAKVMCKYLQTKVAARRVLGPLTLQIILRSTLAALE